MAPNCMAMPEGKKRPRPALGESNCEGSLYQFAAGGGSYKDQVHLAGPVRYISLFREAGAGGHKRE